jgi:DNA-binding NtrC family response regulator
LLETHVAVRAETTRVPELRAGRVLIADDDPAARLSLEALLEEAFEVVSVSCAADAESALAAAPFDVIVSDYDMPGESGLALLRRVCGRYPGLAGILLTGHGAHPEVRAAKDEPAIFMVLQKNYRPAFLLRWVRNGIEYARSRRQSLRSKKE